MKSYKLNPEVTEEKLIELGFEKDLSGHVYMYKINGLSSVFIDFDGMVSAWFDTDILDLFEDGVLIEK